MAPRLNSLRPFVFALSPLARTFHFITADNYSSQQSRRSVAGNQLGIPRVDAQHLKGFVAGLVADLHQVDAALYRSRDQALPNVASVVKAAAAKLGFDPAAFGGHSLRAA